MIDLIELDPAELARIHDVPAELVRCRYCRFAERRAAAGGLAYAAYCTYWEDTVNPKTCCTSWQPRKESEMEEKRVEELTETSMAGSPVININLESGAMLTINFFSESDPEDDDDEE